MGLLIAVVLGEAPRATAQSELLSFEHLVMPGDTWTALAWRYNIGEDQLRISNPHINSQRQPAIGQYVSIPSGDAGETVSSGRLVSSKSGGLYQLSLQNGQNPWVLAKINNIRHIWRPLMFRTIFIPDEKSLPSQLPHGFRTLEVMSIPANPGQGYAMRAKIDEPHPIVASFSDQTIEIYSTPNRLVGLFATGAFFPPGDYALDIEVIGLPLWSQPFHISPRDWNFDEITLTSSAAAIDAESIRLERERLNSIWSQSSGIPLWDRNFGEPIEQYLRITSDYGARRSYNGGPFSSYHEGVDFSAYAGTPVFAPAAGKVVLAETLYVRGGAVIIDHGLGIYTGLYHLSELLVQTDQPVSKGQIIGHVGTTGLSTGNHLHWDLLVNGIWVDASAWQQSAIACWILEGWGRDCPE
jgi:murein DD-endopeptidase MepM/ murein hydrolase activator NlpD